MLNVVRNIWFSDYSDNPKTTFAPGDPIRSHMDVRINGSLGTNYWIKAIKGPKDTENDPPTNKYKSYIDGWKSSGTTR